MMWISAHLLNDLCVVPHMAKGLSQTVALLWYGGILRKRGLMRSLRWPGACAQRGLWEAALYFPFGLEVSSSLHNERPCHRFPTDGELNTSKPVRPKETFLLHKLMIWAVRLHERWLTHPYNSRSYR